MQKIWLLWIQKCQNLHLSDSCGHFRLILIFKAMSNYRIVSVFKHLACIFLHFFQVPLVSGNSTNIQWCKSNPQLQAQPHNSTQSSYWGLLQYCLLDKQKKWCQCPSLASSLRLYAWNQMEASKIYWPFQRKCLQLPSSKMWTVLNQVPSKMLWNIKNYIKAPETVLINCN